MIGWIGGFVFGIVVDAIRSVAAPATTDWLRRLVPSKQRKANLGDNRVQLEIIEKLKALSLEPELVRHADKDVEHFISVTSSQQNAFVERK